MAKKLNLEAWGETEALSFADFNKPRRAGGESFAIDAFGHEENAIGGDFGKFQEERFDFGQIVFG